MPPATVRPATAEAPSHARRGDASLPPVPTLGVDPRREAPSPAQNGARTYAVPQASAMPEEPDDRAPRTPRHGSNRGKIMLLAVCVVLALALTAYFTGLFGRNGDTASQQNAVNAELPSVFESATGTPGGAAPTIAPAQASPAASLRSAAVTPAEAAVPATLTFTLETNAVTTAVRLMDDSDRLLHINATHSAQGDGLLWKITVDMESAYTGKVRVFLRDQAGTWTEGAEGCAVDVR
ncbi:MAG: hypothetical protein PHY64_11195 [Eubacteriales bacterium]|nr:hypothetical protein [Eubacteriales bacterium]